MSIQRSQYVALSLSLLVHVMLGWSLGSSGSMRQSVASARVAEGTPFMAALINSSSSLVPTPHQEKSGSLESSSTKGATKNADLHQLAVNFPSPVSILMAPEPYYFASKELTERPVVVQDVSPNLALNLTGMYLPPVIIRLLISEYGEVDEVIVEDAKLPDEVLTMVKEAFKKMKFQPGVLHDVPVNSQLKIEVSLETIIKISN